MSVFHDSLNRRANDILRACAAYGVRLATVESCTGGLLGAALTELPGASAMFTHGYITYADVAKTEMVGVKPELIATHGAVSAEVARAMAEGGLARSSADLALAITGIAGPGGGSDEKPVGTVHFACARKGGGTRHAQKHFSGDRGAIREAAVSYALEMILEALGD